MWGHVLLTGNNLMYESYCGFCWTQCSISGKTMVLRSFHFMVLLFTKHKDTYYKHTNKYRHIVFYHMVQWLNCRPMKYIELSSLVLFFLCCHFYRHKYMPDWKSMLQRIVVCMRVCLCVLSSVTMNEWMNKLNRIEAILFIFMVKYMTSKQCDSNEYRIIPFKRVVYFYFNNFPHFILYIGANTQKKGWKKLIWKSFKKKKYCKAHHERSQYSKHNVYYYNKPRQQFTRIVWSYKIIVLFKWIELFVFLPFYFVWIRVGFNRFVFSSLAWNII